MAGLNNSQIIQRARDLGINISNEQADKILSQAWDQGQWGADPSTVDQLLRSGSGLSSSPDDMLSQSMQALEEMMNPYKEAEDKYGKYLEENPFNFDEVQARAQAEEQFDPYYESELRDYMTGINRQRSRSKVDEERLRSELNTQTENYVGRAKREIDDALESSREGFAGAGLYFSGKRIRNEGKIGMKGEENIRDYTRQQNLKTDESNLREERTLEDLSLNESKYKRGWKAERESNILGEVADLKKEASLKRDYEAAQYAGGPYTNYANQLLTKI